LATVIAYLSIPVDRRIELDVSRLKELLVFGFPLQLNDVLTFVFLRADTVVIGALMGPAEIAYYEIARKIPESLEGLYEAFRAVYFPMFSAVVAGGKREKAAEMLGHSTRLLAGAGMLGAMVALLFGDLLITTLFSEQYLPSVPVFVLLMVGLTFAVLDYTLGYSLVATGASDKPVAINTIHTAVTLLGNLALIPLVGIIGAALANIAGFAATNPINVFFLRRRELRARVDVYIKPMLVFGGWWALVSLLHPAGLGSRVLVLVLYVLTYLALSVITIEDLLILSREAKAITARALVRVRSWGARI
jgi:O-antigen/teichoic acid export membrane protein